MSCESLALWTIKTLEEGQTLVKELCCSKLYAANCTHCSLLEMLQRLLQKWRDVYANKETDKEQLDQSGYIIVDSKSQMKNGGYEKVLPLNRRERQSKFVRRVKSVHDSFESPMYCEMRPYEFMEQNLHSLTTSNIQTKENCIDSTKKIDPKSIAKSEKQENGMIHFKSSETLGFQGIINSLQNKFAKVENKQNENEESVNNFAKHSNPKKYMIKLPHMKSIDVVVEEASDVDSKLSECQVKSIPTKLPKSIIPAEPLRPIKPEAPLNPIKQKIPLKPVKSAEPLRPVTHAEPIYSTKPAEPPRPSRPLKGNISDTPLPFIPVDGYLDVRRNRTMPQATDLTEVTRVSNIVVNKTKLGKRIIGIKQNEIFVFQNFNELYADFVLDLNSTFSCNNTNSYLVLQNSAMQVTITFYDKIATDKWRRMTSENCNTHKRNSLL